MDNILDAQSLNEGKQRYEKMISGMYLGELCRLLLLQLAAPGAVFAPVSTGGPSGSTASSAGPSSSASSAVPIPRGTGRRLTQPGSFSTAMMSEVADDASEDLAGVATVLANELGLKATTMADRVVVRDVVALVARRAARLAAMGVAAVLHQMGMPDGRGVNVAVDGSVFKKYPKFPELMAEGLADLGAGHAGLVMAEDGSGLGAAIVALIAEHGGAVRRSH